MPMAWMRVGNTQYRPKLLLKAFSESTPLLILNGDFLRKFNKMTNAISVFKFNQNQVRTQLIDGEPWFCLSDARAALSINGSLKKGCTFSENGVRKTPLIDNLGRQQSATFINEPNLYRLIFRSNKPQAQAFADWVYSEVLPSIRKTGGYGTISKMETPAINMKAIGGLVKKCCGVAVRDELAKVKVIEYVNPIKNILSDDLLTESGLTPMEIETHLGHLLTGLWDYKKSSADMYKLYRLLEACKGLACRYYSYASHLQGHVDFCEHYRGKNKNTKYFEMNTDALYATIRGMLDTKIELSALK